MRTICVPSGAQVLVYKPGDHLVSYTRVSRAAYVYLFNVDAQG
ncbi:DUF4384 domain-containing protein [Deinococcus hohokamensis]|uniref:DUF4384 domain-containing protein n=1 Tax=Deinococcus hohokamensis TaxID=309883 RepID=A0ABV9ICB0_9DEIO